MTDTTDLTQVSVDLINALLDSADVKTIGVSNWWGRAQTSLETAAAGAENAGQAVTIASRKLQIDTLSKDSASTVAQVAPLIDQNWQEWSQTVAREAVYLVALARVARGERKEESKRAREETKTPAFQHEANTFEGINF